MSESPEKQPATESREPAQAKTKQAPKKKLPDWQPLGTVRDSFYEAMKQDNRY